MKNTLVLFLLMTVGVISAKAQITRTQTVVETQTKTEELPKYDSLKSLSPSNFKSHIGQSIFLKDDGLGKSRGETSLRLLKTPDFKDWYYRDGVYTYRKRGRGTDYEAVVNKTYYINKIIKVQD